MEKLYVQRRAHRGQFTRLHKDFETALGTDDERSATQILHNLRRKVKHLEGIDNDIMAMLEDPEEIEQFIIESDDKLNTLHATMLDFDLQLQARQSSPTSVAPAEAASAPPSKVNMPKLQLPKFSGDLTEWTTFWELFFVIYTRFAIFYKC